MKKILGLDLGTNSIGWALVNERESENEKSSIIKLGVRVNPLTVDEQRNFEQGKSITTNADRTLKRSMRRNLQRYKLRRENLLDVLKDNGLIFDDSILLENGNKTTFETYRLRAKAATKEISLEELARVLLMINKKRGYKSSRKAKSNDEGQLIDGMEVAKLLYENNLTPGQFTLQILEKGNKYIPDFYRSDLEQEFDKVFDKQNLFYPEILSQELKEELRRKKRDAVWAICAKTFKEKGFELVGTKRQGKVADQKLENYKLRASALTEKLDLEQFVIVMQQINAQLNASSGYLGAISDRSKELYFENQTVGQYQMAELDKNPNYSLRNQVFYRQDYLDEFERIWETQAGFHNELTPELKKVIRDIVIFYQRQLKSQKGLISFCEFESRQIEVEIEGEKKLKTIGYRVCPKSSPLFQEFKIWQILNNLEVQDKSTNVSRRLEQEEKEILFAELNLKDKISKVDVLKLLYKNHKNLDLNYKEIEGNKTNNAFFKAYQSIIELSGHGEYDFSKMQASEIMDIVESVFKGLGWNTDILHFNFSLQGKEFENQAAYKFWHLLYSFEGDNSKLGNEKLINKITELYKFDKEYAIILANVTLQPDYGSLSTKAIRKILPYMKDGCEYSVACQYAGYRHSKNSLTKEELDNKVLKDRLDILPRNSLRNPVVEKILNQMINVVNTIAATYGKPDEIRIELARELKNNAKEREEMTAAINKTTAEHEKYREILQKEFGIQNVSRNDIIRYKLYLELKDNGFKTLYSDTYIPQEKLFSKEFDIEHIIPKAKLFDDSFSNKTIEARGVNINKRDVTAYDYVLEKYGENDDKGYKTKIENLFKKGSISGTKCRKLLMREADIPSDFIERDLRDSQYIAKKAREILEGMVKFVVPTTGSITSRLREDWQLIDIMQELNWNKYKKLGLTETIEDKDGRIIRRIKDWTKRNDHRHHAMDALTIAFTKSGIIQYLNNLNARSDKSSSIYGIEQNELSKDNHGKPKFNPPMPLDEFRTEAKRQLENILISIKAKNKVVTKNINITKKEEGTNKKIQLTPRGQLHNETVYGRIKKYATKEEKIGSAFDAIKITTVANKKYREALLARLTQYGNDATKAFTGKNSLDKNPIFLNEQHTETVPIKVKTVEFEDVYKIRKEVSKDLKLEKVVDSKIRKILENRLKEFGGDANKAFSNLDENPIWQNKKKGIAIKRVSIYGVSNAEALHDKHDQFGKPILDKEGKTQPADFVSTSNNHHIAIYRDLDGNLKENVVSFYEATMRANIGNPIVDKDYKKAEGWQFLFTMKQNEYFVFPNKETDFDPNVIDLLDPDNFAVISPNLYRVQIISSKDYTFRHHLETTVVNNIKDYTFKRIRNTMSLEGILKVRVNHIGQIVSVGEY
ncbi:MAG: type II CRISPR RNA-guided endonuclease Cas9 [Bacteroidia bacterium]|nr:type II CRISPR RNA-guided endonuclease Cas9 [Bacteroidia bacterium]